MFISAFWNLLVLLGCILLAGACLLLGLLILCGVCIVIASTIDTIKGEDDTNKDNCKVEEEK